MPSCIDHFMYAVPRLDEGLAWAQDVFGVAPAYGGEHVGMGTCNALLSLGDTYLEIIAPDPAQTLKGNLGERFAELPEGGLVTFAVQGELGSIAEQLNQAGIDCRGPNRTQRKTSEGQLLEWELLIPRRNQFGARLPFFIDWLACDHPSKTNPMAGQFEELVITHPKAFELTQVFGAIELNQKVGLSDEPTMHATIATASGQVMLTSTAATRDLTMG